MIKELLEKSIKEALLKACRQEKLGLISDFQGPVEIERPRRAEHGDFSSSLPLKLASLAETSPLQLARALSSFLSESTHFSVEVSAPGFINMQLKNDLLQEILVAIHQSNIDRNFSTEIRLQHTPTSEDFQTELPANTRINQIFFLQYVQARCSAFLRHPLEPGLDIDNKCEDHPLIDSQTWLTWQQEYATMPDAFAALFHEELADAFAAQKDLILHLDEAIEVSTEAREVSPWERGRPARFYIDLAEAIEDFLAYCRYQYSNESILKARLGLILASKYLLKNALTALKIPELDRL